MTDRDTERLLAEAREWFYADADIAETGALIANLTIALESSERWRREAENKLVKYTWINERASYDQA